ncbi:hypothetical protein [Limosilactobacillus oris]|uniref:hypothetical protein n=1 Tax=Limosilactobacillus oris TaxID=1632 RepID=UPI0032082B6A
MKRNIFLVFTGLETLAVGVFLMMQRNALMDDPTDRVVHMIHQMGSIEWATLLIVLGAVSLVVGVLDVKKYNIQQVILILFGGLWCAYSLFFWINDIHFGPGLKLGTLLSTFVFVQILFEAYFGKRG